MKTAITLLVLFSSFSMGEIKIPKHQKFYISGIEFDTQVYCADFTKVIEEQAQKIKSLEEEITILRKEHQERLSEKLEESHKKELEETKKPKKAIPAKSKIIISDKPI